MGALGRADGARAPYLNRLRTDGANLTQMYAEEHHSEGNYFWLISGSNQGVGFIDSIPAKPITTRNLGEQLLGAGRTFAGYSEDLPAIGSTWSAAIAILLAAIARRLAMTARLLATTATLPDDDRQTTGDDRRTTGDDRRTAGDDRRTAGDDCRTAGDDRHPTWQ